MTIQLINREQTGVDGANRPEYTETPEDVENILVGEPTADDITDALNLTGKKAVYVLGIPKGDTHNWTDRKVRFWGQTFRTVGFPVYGIEVNMPLSWIGKVMVERYG